MTKLVGILNLTPDSFSDGGQAGSVSEAVRHMQTLFEDGAALVDIGAESTRPGATPISADEEWQRLEPFMREVRQHHAARLQALSIDTRHPETARRVLEYGVGWINDVSGFSSPAMIQAVKGAPCDLVVMHSLGVPADPRNTLPEGADPVALLRKWAEEKVAKLGGQGIAQARIIFDPGIGFGKTAEQSKTIIDRIGELKMPGVRLLVGHSRKSFLALYTGAAPKDRDAETARISALLADAGVDFLRVHNVKANRAAL